MISSERETLQQDVNDDVLNLVASPYLMRPLRSLPAAKEMQNLRARLVEGRNRRVSVRRPSEAAATAVASNNPQPFTCTVRDISESGARIEIPDGTGALPKFMTLHILAMQTVIECERRWQRGNEVGLAFVFSADD